MSGLGTTESAAQREALLQLCGLKNFSDGTLSDGKHLVFGEKTVGDWHSVFFMICIKTLFSFLFLLLLVGINALPSS